MLRDTKVILIFKETIKQKIQKPINLDKENPSTLSRVMVYVHLKFRGYLTDIPTAHWFSMNLCKAKIVDHL